ncbi:MAG: sporulation protein YpjB [Candidatus Cohnella colombiensis]|uniref:Sporulation protein YpjB n=1 Tax=Candidatus Cohnella colombiensis TaxID=3121368 RepID=A0AA95JH68_9BACL|nr:MAG: sporulation protein YpjB [Cohnella sp.]
MLRSFGVQLVRVMILAVCGMLAMIQVNVKTLAAPAIRNDYKSFLKSAETLYTAVNNGDFAQVLTIMKVIEQRLIHLSLKDVVSAEGIEALAANVAGLKKATIAVKQDPLQWQMGAAKLRLAADALANPDQPLWFQYQSVLKEDISTLKGTLVAYASGQQVPKAALTASKQLQQHYQLIRTAALLKLAPELIERSDSVFRYMNTLMQAQSPKYELVQNMMEPLQDAITALFPEDGKATATTIVGATSVPLGWMITLGVFIIAVLSWASWKRYQSEH